MNKKIFLCVSLVTLLLSACGESEKNSQNEIVKPKAVISTTVIGSPRPEFTLPDIDGVARNIKEWDGKVLIINFWATWCPPCRREMPAFIELQDELGAQGLQFIGIAIDEADKVTDFSDTYGINYPMLLGDLAAIDVGKKYGNRFGALPYTVIVDRQGKIAFTRRGELTKDEAIIEVKKLL